jgi:hypothetical protein
MGTARTAGGAVRRIAALALVLGLAMAMLPATAAAVTTPVVDPPTSLLANATATYTAHATTTEDRERVRRVTFTFPANTDLSGVSAATVTVFEQPGNIAYAVTQVTTDAVACTVEVRITFPRANKGKAFDVNVGGVVNGSQPGAGYNYSVLMASDKTVSMTGTRAYSLAANASAVGVGTVVLGSNQPAVASSYTVPLTLGAKGRLSGTTAAGANTIVVTFPAGTTVPTAPPAGSVTIDGVAAGTIAVNVPARQVTLTLAANQTIAGGSTFPVVFGTTFGLRNPAAGTYTLVARTSAETGTGTSPGYVIGAVPYLTMTIDATSVDFGAVDPGVTSAPRVVNVTVDSSAPFTITRLLSGDFALLDLIVTGAANGAKPAGLAAYADSYSITPPWTTDPDVPLLAQVQYTAVQ